MNASKQATLKHLASIHKSVELFYLNVGWDNPTLTVSQCSCHLGNGCDEAVLERIHPIKCVPLMQKKASIIKELIQELIMTCKSFTPAKQTGKKDEC
jgi:hypothetical protein